MMGKRRKILSDIFRSTNAYFSERGYEAAKSSLKKILQFSKDILVTFDQIDTYCYVEGEPS